MGIHPKILPMVYGVECETKSVEILGDNPVIILEPKKLIRDFSTFFANNSRTEQDIVNRKSALKTTNTPLGGSVILSTLVY